MTKTIDFYFDFASPNAYMAYRVLPAIAERTGAPINYLPVLLGGIFKTTGNQAPMIAFANVKGKIAYEMLEVQRFLKKHELTQFKMNSAFPVISLMLMRGAIHAQNTGQLEPYIEAGMKAMWEMDRKMDDPEIFVSTLNELGFDGPAFLDATQDAAIKSTLAINTKKAVDRGLFGIPSFFVDDEMFFGKERLGQVEEAVLSA